MKQVMLYTGNGVSLSPVPAEGRRESAYVRLVAEENMAITNGTAVTICLDVRKETVSQWTDCPLPPEDAEVTEADYQQALQEMGVRI